MTTAPTPAATLSDREDITVAELQLAARNHGMPLEALRYAVTPVGLHYLLIHYDIPPVPADWSLTVGGRVSRELSLSLEALRARPGVRAPVTMECAGNGRARLAPRPISQPWLLEAVGTAEWGGIPLRALLEEAGVLDDAVEVLFTGADRGIEGGVEQRYERSLTLADALRDDVLLAFEMNGGPLPPQHGAPLRLVAPGWYGMAHVKWLRAVTVIDTPFTGYQQDRSYRLRRAPEDEGEPVTRMAPRALMVPPGLADFASRERTVELAPCLLEGRAWSGWGPIAAVRVSSDGGATWADAVVEDHPAASAWARWTYRFAPPAPGDYVLCCRARDACGNEQPVEAEWNLGGYANNAVQRVAVTVRPPA